MCIRDSDGLEHGAGIDEHDPTCDADCASLLSNSCVVCAQNCSTCPAGRYGVAGLNQYAKYPTTGCLDCPVGRYLEDPGTYASDRELHDALDDCVPCPPGTYGDVAGASACARCGPGSYAAGAGSLYCSTAAPGTFVATAGAASPETCPPGRYSLGGASECRACAAGRFAPESAASACLLADAGSHVATEASSEQAACPAGRRSSGSGASDCEACAAQGSTRVRQPHL